MFVDTSSGEATHGLVRCSRAYYYIPRHRWWTHLRGSMLLPATDLLLMRFLGGKEIPASTSYMGPSLMSVVPTMWVQPPFLMCGPIESSCRLPSSMGGPPPVCWRPATMVPHSSCPTRTDEGSTQLGAPRSLDISNHRGALLYFMHIPHSHMMGFSESRLTRTISLRGKSIEIIP